MPIEPVTTPLFGTNVRQHLAVAPFRARAPNRPEEVTPITHIDDDEQGVARDQFAGFRPVAIVRYSRACNVGLRNNDGTNTARVSINAAAPREQ